ncbi:MAG: TetR family transcriptional regulator [Deltaproteobacteria bacterium]|nr:MAG: TetR family transcriptional regulator [Deltaproteobacteria bacterium]
MNDATKDKLTRKEAKERTRQRLIDAVLEHVRKNGLTGLTTGRVADRAGIAQSSFYVHFSDMDDALRAAADQAGEQIRALIRDARQRVDFSDPEAALHAAYQGALRALVDEPEFTELLLSHRRDRNSPLAAALRRVLQEARDDLAQDLARAGYADWFARDIDVYADLMVGMTLSAAEAVLDRRVRDQERLLRALAATTRALLASARPPRG